MNKKAEILAMLRESRAYISGQELCAHFGVSRTAVWKAVNQLKEEGYRVEAVQNKGYHLVTSPDILGEDEILSRLKTDWAGRNIVFLEETGSTNNDAKRLGEENAPHGTLVVTERQNTGRGRRGREWDSPRGCNLYFTLLLRPRCHPDNACRLTLLMALAVAAAIQDLLPADTVHRLTEAERSDTVQRQDRTGIKWPNDVVINGRKVCGILTEMSMETDLIHHVVIGTGINVNQEQFSAQIRETATSLKREGGGNICRAELLACVMGHFEKYYRIFEQTQDLSGLQECYQSQLVNLGKQVRVLDPQCSFAGTARGINDQGELLVEREDGTVETVYAGEVSVRGIYGYV